MVLQKLITPMAAVDCSVIVPVYEQSDLLPFLITSLIAQETRFRYEVIICDDGSTTSPLSAIESLYPNLTFEIRYHRQQHRGRRVAQARNNGIRNSRGEILIFVDGDSILPSSFIESHMNFHRSNMRVLYCGTRQLIFIDPERRKSLPNYQTSSRLLEEFSVCQSIDIYKWQDRVFVNEPWRACMACNMSARRDSAIYFDEAFRGWGFEDVELAYRLIHRHGYRLAISPPVSLYSIEIGQELTYSTVKPRSSAEIEAFLTDLFRFERIHPEANLSSFFKLCRLFRRDRLTDQWIRIDDISASQRNCHDAVAEVRSWCADSLSVRAALADQDHSPDIKS